jgi:hypothetical protein
LKKGGNRKSPFVKGDLEGFSSAQHDFDETLGDSQVDSTSTFACDRSKRFDLSENSGAITFGDPIAINEPR